MEGICLSTKYFRELPLHPVIALSLAFLLCRYCPIWVPSGPAMWRSVDFLLWCYCFWRFISFVDFWKLIFYWWDAFSYRRGILESHCYILVVTLPLINIVVSSSIIASLNLVFCAKPEDLTFGCSYKFWWFGFSSLLIFFNLDSIWIGSVVINGFLIVILLSLTVHFNEWGFKN